MVVGEDHQELARGPAAVLVLPLAGCVSWASHLPSLIFTYAEGGPELLPVKGLVCWQP